MANPGARDTTLAAMGLEVRTNNGRRVVNRLRSTNDRPARLAKIKRVGEVWQECMFGIGGNKPAKDFTDTEHRGTGGTYSRRKPIYEVMATLVRAGRSPASVIKTIDDLCPGVPLLTLGKRLRDAMKNNTLHQSLRV